MVLPIITEHPASHGENPTWLNTDHVLFARDEKDGGCLIFLDTTGFDGSPITLRSINHAARDIAAAMMVRYPESSSVVSKPTRLSAPILSKGDTVSNTVRGVTRLATVLFLDAFGITDRIAIQYKDNKASAFVDASALTLVERPLPVEGTAVRRAASAASRIVEFMDELAAEAFRADCDAFYVSLTDATTGGIPELIGPPFSGTDFAKIAVRQMISKGAYHSEDVRGLYDNTPSAARTLARRFGWDCERWDGLEAATMFLRRSGVTPKMIGHVLYGWPM